MHFLFQSIGNHTLGAREPVQRAMTNFIEYEKSVSLATEMDTIIVRA